MKTLWLIAEDESGAQIFRAIFERRFPEMHVPYILPRGNHPNISRLAIDIEDLINNIHVDKRRKADDCIVVLHDLNAQRRTETSDYDKIKKACEKAVKDGLKLLECIAVDEIESWLLADSGVCQWLGEKRGNYDTKAAPKDILNGWLKRKGKITYYSVRGRDEVFKHIVGDGDQKEYSPSMRWAFTALTNASCTT